MLKGCGILEGKAWSGSHVDERQCSSHSSLSVKDFISPGDVDEYILPLLKSPFWMETWKTSSDFV